MDLRFALLLTCFFLSGFAALLYQTAWTRELSFVFGTSELAVAAVLAAYMGGLALGAAVAARFAPRLRRPVLVYGVLELAIAVSALLVPVAIWLINRLYVAWLGGGTDLAPAGAAATAFQLGAAFAVLLPPTAFMGATLPLLARHAVRREAEIGPRIGLLYAINTAGAIAGTLCAAFWLMPELGLRRTVWVGALLNGAVFLLAARLARGAASLPEPEPARSVAAPPGAGWILPAIAVSGAVSFAYEVLWTRLLGHLIGSSVQAFATMLASFLVGIALGSAFAARLATSRERAAIGFGAAQLGIAVASWAALALADRLPSLARELGAGPGAALASAAVAALPLLPITLCIGATFPFAVRLLAPHPEQAARATARAYAWNTVGAIAGALGAGFVVLPGLGFAGTVAAGVAVSLALAALAGLAGRPRRLALVAAAAAAGVALLVFPPRSPWTLLSTSPMAGVAASGEIVFSAVGRSSTVMLFEMPTHFRLTSNGLPESSILPRGGLPESSVARWLGILPSLVRPGARDLLVVGLGGGMALEIVPATVESIDVIELEPEVLHANQHIAAERALDPLADPRVRVTLADARGALQLSDRRWDAIVSQPSHPWTAGASHLYTREFFELARSRLAPDGVFVQWIGLAFVDAPLLRSLLATLREVFAHVEAYQPEGGGLLFAASDAPLGLAGVPEALRSAPADYARLGLDRLEDVAAARLLDDEGTRALAEGAQRNTDDRNLLAARAAQLGKAALDAESTRALMRGLDPLASGSDGLDTAAVVRALVGRGFRERADALARSRTGAEEELALGWIELSVGRKTRAARHFSRALDLDPAARDAHAGLVACWLAVLAGGGTVPNLSDGELDGELSAVVEGFRRARVRDWNSVARLDAELARIQPGEPLFEEASRLRIQWRLAAEGADRAAEAQAIAETLLARRWSPDDGLLRAEAALAANRPWEARATLERIARGRQHAAWARPAFDLAQRLPDEIAGDLPERLARVAGRGQARSEADAAGGVSPAAAEGTERTPR